MRIALTGSSSTGKTTVADQLMKVPAFADVVGEFVTEDARSLLESLGHQSMDKMTREELRGFQQKYLRQKANNERDRKSFLVDRSYVDVAAYWLVRDSYDLSHEAQHSFASECRELARSYDLHVYFPYGQIPFQSDGYRSEDESFHRRIAAKILELLDAWAINFISIDSPAIDARINQILSELKVQPINGDSEK